MLLEQKLLVAKKQFSHKKIKAILIFLRNYIVFAKKETNRIFDKQINKITYQNNSMGIVEYFEELEVQKQVAEQTAKSHRQFVVNLLKGTDFSMTKIASLAGVSVYFVKKVKASLTKKPTTHRLTRAKA